MKTKRFHLGAVLSMTTTRLVAPRGMAGVHEIIEWVAGYPVWTHQIPRVMRDAEPFLRAHFPHLATYELQAELDEVCETPEDGRSAAIDKWLRGACRRFGEWHEVPQLPPNSDGPRDPVQEAEEMFGKDRVVALLADKVLEDGETP